MEIEKKKCVQSIGTHALPNIRKFRNLMAGKAFQLFNYVFNFKYNSANENESDSRQQRERKFWWNDIVVGKLYS